MQPRPSLHSQQNAIVKELLRSIETTDIELCKKYITLIEPDVYNQHCHEFLINAAETLSRTLKQQSIKPSQDLREIIIHLLRTNNANFRRLITRGKKQTTAMATLLDHVVDWPGGFGDLIIREIPSITKITTENIDLELPAIIRLVEQYIPLDKEAISANSKSYLQIFLRMDLQYSHPNLFFHRPDIAVMLLDGEDSTKFINRDLLIRLMQDKTIFTSLPEKRQLELLQDFLHNKEDDEIVVAILTHNPVLIPQLQDNFLVGDDVRRALQAAIRQNNQPLALQILQQHRRDPADVMTLFYNAEQQPTTKVKKFLLERIGNIFKRDDASEVFDLAAKFSYFDMYDELNAMPQEVDRAKVMKAVEEQLREFLLRNPYHVPEISDLTYDRLKKHGFLSAEFIASIENFSQHVAEMPKVDWQRNQDMLDETLVRMMSTLKGNPLLSKKLGAKLCSLSSIDFFDSGKSMDNWSDMLKFVVSKAPAPEAKHGESCIDLETNSEAKTTANESITHMLRGYHFLRLQGRTILLENRKKDIIAIKVRKYKEDPQELHREAKAVAEFQQKADEMKLQSYFPKPLTVTTLDQESLSGMLRRFVDDKVLTNRERRKFADMVFLYVGNEFPAYIYQVDRAHRNYFTYLHDAALSDEEFVAANRTAVSDLYRSLANGVVFHQLADIFHNKEQVDDRDDKGRYIVLPNLVSYYALVLSSSRHGAGTGRLTGWQEAIAYPNIRGSGLADFGDIAPLKDFFREGEKARHFFGAASRAYRNKTGNYLMANIMAEYQYVLYLIAGFRACKLTKDMTDETQIKKIWQDAAMQLLNNCAQAISILTPQSEEAARLFLLSQVKVERLGRQMQFWMRETPDGFEYLPHVKQNSIPQDVYGPKVKVNLDIHRFREGTFNRVSKEGKEMGFAIDGEHADLGPVNGQEPVKEKDKLFHWMVTMIFSAYHEHRLTRENIAALRAEKSKQGYENELKDAFTHLPPRQYHATMFSLTKRDLEQKKIVTRHSQKEVVEKLLQARKHKLEYSAATIQETWRAHKFRKVLQEEKVAVDDQDKPLFRIKR